MTIDELFRTYVDSCIRVNIDNAVRESIEANFKDVIQHEVAKWLEDNLDNRVSEIVKNYYSISEENIRDVVRNMSFSVDISADIDVD